MSEQYEYEHLIRSNRDPLIDKAVKYYNQRLSGLYDQDSLENGELSLKPKCNPDYQVVLDRKTEPYPD